MTTPNAPTPPADKAAKPMTAAEAAKKVLRTVTVMVDGEDAAGQPIKVPKSRKAQVTEKEVFDFKDYGTHVIVVTVDGQKLSSLDA